LTVSVNGTGRKLRVDTGAREILINSRVAERAGVQKIEEESLAGIGDKSASPGYLGFAEKIEIDCRDHLVDFDRTPNRIRGATLY
jgi:hypothetical protein